MTSLLAAFFAEAAAAAQRQDGAHLAALLSHDAPRPLAAVRQCLAQAPSTNLGLLASQHLPPPLDEVLALHARVLAFSSSKPDDACVCRRVSFALL
jgi:hypothetical protein